MNNFTLNTERKILEHLKKVARQRALVSYSELNEALGLGLDFQMRPSDRTLVGEWLGDLSKRTVEIVGHMISALVVEGERRPFGDGWNYKEPGPGFFDYAQTLGVFNGIDNLGFWSREVAWWHAHVNVLDDMELT